MKGEFHIGAGNKVKPCEAEKVPCRLKHYKLESDAEAAAKELRDNEQKKLAAKYKEQPLRKNLERATGKGRQDQLPSIVVPKHQFAVLTPDTFNATLIHVYDIAEYNVGLEEITSVNAKKLIEKGLNLPYKQWPKSLKELYQQHSEPWENPTNWSVREPNPHSLYYNDFYESIPYNDLYDPYAEDYYDESYDEHEIDPPQHLKETMLKWYYSLPNARDELRVLEHVREKGFPTEGLTPIEAIKKLLREENDRILPYVEEATNLGTNKVRFDQIKINRGYFHTVEPREPKTEAPETKYDGVLYRDSNGTYRLMDGYHRLKWNTEHGKKAGKYIVLY